MATYSVGVQNAYDILAEEDGKPQQKKRVVEQKKEQKASKKPIPSTAIPAAVSGELPAEKPFAGRGPLQETRGRGRGRGRGGRGRGGRPPKRDSDRVSGTGRGRETRKGGAGGYAAEGTVSDDLAAQTGTPIDVVAETAVEVVEVVEPTEEEKEAAAKKAAEEEEEKKKITLDQFREMEKKKTVEADLNRKLREVKIDDKKFKSGKTITKGQKDIGVTLYEKEDPYANKEAKAAAAAKKAAEDKAKKDKKVFNLFEFKEKVAPADAAPASAPATDSAQGFIPAGGRGGRGGRGGARGGPRGGARGARGGVRGGRRVDLDESNFPKLG